MQRRARELQRQYLNENAFEHVVCEMAAIMIMAWGPSGDNAMMA